MVDLAEAHVAALKYLEQDSDNNYEVFNVGTGTGTTVLQLINAFEKTTGVKLNFIIGQRRAGDIEKVWRDVSRSAALLKWKAGHGIDDMMRIAWAWEQSIAELSLI